MKKFLSLVLAMIMALSLVTISAGAVEYSELTDKDEINFEEAVSVLNKIGIIEGYGDGSYRPDAPLTRQVAAKFIVSLLIGPDAADTLTAAVAPYPDVPVSSQFAGYISYCKTANIISGYSDGTFKPEESLTGYAFSKMLLGAIGYRSDIEGFTGTGWTMNVARIGNAANLFNRIEFAGGETVNRETAAQLCLNTLKATMVEYSGGFNITTGDATVTGAMTRSYVTSNQTYAANISNRKVSDLTVGGGTTGGLSTPYTVEFGEEHFKDLRLNYDGTALDAFGRPSNEWSWKKVTFGTFPLDPDFVYTEQVAHNVSDVTDATKVRALGLSGYVVNDGTNDTDVYINGVGPFDLNDFTGITDNKVASIADLTDNGTIVEVYVSDTQADFISHVVVIQTQMMEIKRVGNDFVSLDTISHDDQTVAVSGYNQEPINVRVVDVEEDNVNYSFLSGLKAEDLVAVIPVAIDRDGDEFEVDTAYTPEEVTGKLTRVDIYGKSEADRQATTVTVGGTKYNIALWHKDLGDIKADDIKVTRDDVKLYLDMFGNALRAKNVGKTSDFMVIKGYSSGLVNGKLVHYVDGWDIKGNEISLNIGSNDNTYDAYRDEHRPGDLVHYTNENASGSAEWVLNREKVANIDTSADGHNSGLSASNVRVKLVNNATPYHVADGMKFIYVTFDGDGDVESIEVTTGMKSATVTDLNTRYSTATGSKYNPAEACIDKDGDVSAIVVKKESNEAISSNMLYVRDVHSMNAVDEDGTKIYGYTAAMMSADGLNPKVSIYGNKDLEQGWFASYAASERDGYDPFYTLRHYTATNKTTSVVQATVWQVINEGKDHLLKLTDYVKVDGSNDAAVPDVKGNWSVGLGVGDEANIVDLHNAEWLDLWSNDHIDSVKDLRAAFVGLGGSAAAGADDGYPIVKIIFNDDNTSKSFRSVSMIVIESSVEHPTNPDNYIPNLSDTNFTPVLDDTDGNSGNVTYKTPQTNDAGETAHFSYDLKLSAADLANPNLVLKLNLSSEYATVVPSEGYTNPQAGQTYWFTVRAGDGTTKLVSITIDADASDIVSKVYRVWFQGSPSAAPVGTSSSSINVHFYVTETHSNPDADTPPQTGHWLSKGELEELGLSAGSFKLTADGKDYTPTSFEVLALSEVAPEYTTSGAWKDEPGSGFIKVKFTDESGQPAAKPSTNDGSTARPLSIETDLNITVWDWLIA